MVPVPADVDEEIPGDELVLLDTADGEFHLPDGSVLTVDVPAPPENGWTLRSSTLPPWLEVNLIRLAFAQAQLSNVGTAYDFLPGVLPIGSVGQDHVADAGYVDDSGRWWIDGSLASYFEPEVEGPIDYALPGNQWWDGWIAAHVRADGGWEPSNLTPPETGAGYPEAHSEGVPVAANWDSDDFHTEFGAYWESVGTWLTPGAAGGDIVEFGRGVDEVAGGLHDVPTPWDRDGDTVDEVAVYRPTDGTFHTPGEGQVADLPVGYPVPGDYDGDGYDEAAVFVVTENRWYFEDGSTLDLDAPPALTSVPVPADYDGDGSDDPAMWDLATNTHYTHGDEAVDFEGSMGYPVALRPGLKASLWRLLTAQL
jgi:hypothetical protein